MAGQHTALTQSPLGSFMTDLLTPRSLHLLPLLSLPFLLNAPWLRPLHPRCQVRHLALYSTPPSPGCAENWAVPLWLPLLNTVHLVGCLLMGQLGFMTPMYGAPSLCLLCLRPPGSSPTPSSYSPSSIPGTSAIWCNTALVNCSCHRFHLHRFIFANTHPHIHITLYNQ